MAKIPTEFDLVFEGGGAKGTVFIGALQEFEARGLKPRRLVGTSAGAITATLVAAGYGAAQLEEFAQETTSDGKPVFATFMDIPDSFEDEVINNSLTQRIFARVDMPGIPGFVEKIIDRSFINWLMKIDVYRELFSFIERGGLYGGEQFRKWIGDKLEQRKSGLGRSTLSEFHNETGNDLSLVASDTEARQRLVLNHRTAPDCPIDWAVRMSMSIPFVWQEVCWKQEWGKYQNHDLTDHTIVDGGLLSNFPLELVTDDDAKVRAVMGDTDPNVAGTIGLLIDENEQVPGSGSMRDEGEDARGEGLLGDRERLKTIKRVMRLINTMMDAHDKKFIKAHPEHICRLPAKGYGTTEFGMSQDRKAALIRAGRSAMEKYLKTLIKE